MKNSSQAQRVGSIYRRQIEMAKQLDNIQATIRLDHEVRALHGENTRKLIDHVQRLLAEKETLVKMIGWAEIERQLHAANSYTSEPLVIKPEGINLRSVPVATVTITAPDLHAYDPAGRRCIRCACLREALEASGTLFCEGETP